MGDDTSNVSIDRGHDRYRDRLDDRTPGRGARLVSGLRDDKYRAGRRRSHLFRFCELHDARLWRCHASATLASAWADDGDERRAAVWLVDRRDLRGLADDADGERRRIANAGETPAAWIATRARTCRAATSMCGSCVKLKYQRLH